MPQLRRVRERAARLLLEVIKYHATRAALDEETAVADRSHDQAGLRCLVEHDLPRQKRHHPQSPGEARRRVTVALLRRHRRPACRRRKRRVQQLLAAVEARQLLHREGCLQANRQHAGLDLRLLRRNHHRHATLLVEAEPIARARRAREDARSTREIRGHHEQLVLRAYLVDGPRRTAKQQVLAVGREARIVSGLLRQTLLHVAVIIGEVQPVTRVERDGPGLRRTGEPAASAERELRSHACVAHEIVGERRSGEPAHQLRDLIGTTPDGGERQLAELGKRVVGEHLAAVDIDDARLQRRARFTIEATQQRVLAVARESLEIPVTGIRLRCRGAFGNDQHRRGRDVHARRRRRHRRTPARGHGTERGERRHRERERRQP